MKSGLFSSKDLYRVCVVSDEVLADLRNLACANNIATWFAQSPQPLPSMYSCWHITTGLRLQHDWFCHSTTMSAGHLSFCLAARHRQTKLTCLAASSQTIELILYVWRS